MEKSQVYKVLSLVKGAIKADLHIYTLTELSRKYGVEPCQMHNFIFSDKCLSEIYKRAKRKREQEKKVELFQKDLNDVSCCNLAESVIKLAVKEHDVYFFRSGNYEFFQEFTQNKKSADYYINKMAY